MKNQSIVIITRDNRQTKRLNALLKEWGLDFYNTEACWIGDADCDQIVNRAAYGGMFGAGEEYHVDYPLDDFLTAAERFELVIIIEDDEQFAGVVQEVFVYKRTRNNRARAAYTLLKKRYKTMRFTLEDNKRGDLYIRRTNPQGHNTKEGQFAYWQSSVSLPIDHAELEVVEKLGSVQSRLLNDFTSLYFSVHSASGDGWKSHIWVRQIYDDGKMTSGDGTGKSLLSPLTSDDRNFLIKLNKEAAKSLQEGWFYCMRCKTAKPREEYGYFYFAERRCKTCLAETPDWERRARSESYN